MAYREDADLEFLSKLKSDDLSDLVYIITHDKDGSQRFTETLTVSEEYKRYSPNHNMYWQKIAEEIQCFGANSIITLFRGGKGVLYKEILMDVCDKMKVNYSKESSAEKIESNLLMKILEDALEKMSPEDIRSLADSAGIDHTKMISISGNAALAVFQAVFKAGGFRSYQLTLIIVNTVMKTLMGRGLSLAGNAALTRGMAVLSGPIGWAIAGAWSAFDVASPAYRVTIPAVIQIAAMRQKSLYANQ